MKKRVRVFVTTVIMALSIVPIINLSSNRPQITASGWLNPTMLYNLDFAASWLTRILYPLGISTNPQEVIIGYADWLYLGDEHAATRTVTRRGVSPEDIERGRRIAEATLAWERWLGLEGVRLYRIMVGPNKETIYPEYLPEWAKPAASAPVDTLFNALTGERYIDPRAALAQAKDRQSQPLYYRLDTHWNSLGAAHTLRVFADHIHQYAPSLRWPFGEVITVSRVGVRPFGDLAGLLRLSAPLQDPEPAVEINTDGPIDIVQRDLDSGQIIAAGGNPRIETPTSALHVSSDSALNAKRVLWLRDSFGEALAPFMAATFTETVQLHWSDALEDDGRRLIELVQSWQPDYVFVTVVERSALSELFTTLPPLIASSDRTHFFALRASHPRARNHLQPGDREDVWQIAGDDPGIEYSLVAPISSRVAPVLAFDLVCAHQTDPVAIQVYWLGTGDAGFSETNSTRFTTRPGSTVVDLAAAPGWLASGDIVRLRLDIDSPQACQSFTLSDLELGDIR